MARKKPVPGLVPVIRSHYDPAVAKATAELRYLVQIHDMVGVGAVLDAVSAELDVRGERVESSDDMALRIHRLTARVAGERGRAAEYLAARAQRAESLTESTPEEEGHSDT